MYLSSELCSQSPSLFFQLCQLTGLFLVLSPERCEGPLMCC